MIRVKLDLKPLGNALLYMSTAQREQAIRDALNRSMDKMFTTAKREINKEANITISDIARALKKHPASGGALSAEVVAKDRWYPGGYKPFGARQSMGRGGGTSFTPWKGHTEVVKGGFIATMKSGHTSVFVRIKPAQRRGKNRSWLPIKDVGWGPNPAKEMVREDKPTPHQIRMAAQAVFNDRFARSYERVVAQAKAKFGL